jgi:hypothetical protein
MQRRIDLTVGLSDLFGLSRLSGLSGRKVYPVFLAS